MLFRSQHHRQHKPGSAFADDLFRIPAHVVRRRVQIGQNDGSSSPERDKGQHHRSGDEDLDYGTLQIPSSIPTRKNTTAIPAASPSAASPAANTPTPFRTSPAITSTPASTPPATPSAAKVSPTSATSSSCRT